MDIDSTSLAELFAAADAIGDKYLTPEELAERDRNWQAVQSDLAEAIGHECECDDD